MKRTLTKDILREFALSIGFHLIGFTDPHVNNETKERFLRWIDENKHAGLWYLSEKERLKTRFHPERLLEGVKTVIVFGVSYRDNLFGRHVEDDRAYISTYALRRDYHKVMKKKLKAVVEFMKEYVPQMRTRIFVDTAPIFERYFAQKAGVGFIGKNNFLINPELGGLIFLGEILTDFEFQPDSPIVHSCGSCNLCIDACPTGALLPYDIDLSLCISYHTIENNKGLIDRRVEEHMGNRVFGCDECAIACPYNERGKDVISFFGEDIREDLFGIPILKLLRMNEHEFNTIFHDTPIRRTGYTAFMRNVLVAACNTKSSNLVEEAKRLCNLAEDELLVKTCRQLAFLD